MELNRRKVLIQSWIIGIGVALLIANDIRLVWATGEWAFLGIVASLESESIESGQLEQSETPVSWVNSRIKTVDGTTYEITYDVRVADVWLDDLGEMTVVCFENGTLSISAYAPEISDEPMTTEMDIFCEVTD